MRKTKTLFSCFILFVFLTGGSSIPFVKNKEVKAQEDISFQDISAQDLGISEPKLLPDSPFYFLKDLSRGIRTFFAFNPIKKAKLKMKFASEKLLEAKKLIEKGKIEKAEKVLKKHNLDLEKARKLLLKKRGKPEAELVLEKLTERIIAHQKILDKVEEKLPLKRLVKLRAIKREFLKESLENEDPKKIQQRMEKIVEKARGNIFKGLKNLQILICLKEKTPEKGKEGIEKAIEAQLNQLKKEFENLSPELREKLKIYLSQISGDKTCALESLTEIESLEIPQDLKEEIEKAKDELLEKLKERINRAEKENIQQYPDQILKRLEKGDIVKLRILKELEEETDLPEDFLSLVVRAQQKNKERIFEKLEKLPPKKQQKLLEKIAKKATLRTLKVLQENEDLLPPEKKQKLEEIKKAIEQKITKELKKANKNPQLLKVKMKRFLEGTPEEIDTLKKLPLSLELKKELEKELQKRLYKKLERIEDPEKFERFKEKLEQKEIPLSPEILKKAREIRGRISVEMVKRKIENAKKLMKELEEQLEAKKEKVFLPEYKKIITLKKIAESQLNQAIELLEEGKIGESWGKVTSCVRKIRSVSKTLEKIELKKEIEKERMKKFKQLLPNQKHLPKDILNCPLPKKPHCKKGTVVKKIKDEKGCIKFVCEPKKEKVVCAAVWDPVCGIDGKTYPNRCVAEKIAKVKIAYKGECKREKNLQKKFKKEEKLPLNFQRKIEIVE